MKYKLTDKQFNLASAFQKWQMNKFGDVVSESNSFAPGNDREVREENKIEEINLSKNENLNHEHDTI